MLCINCLNKAFCKHYDMAINSYDVVFSINKCSYYATDTKPEIKTYKDLNDKVDTSKGTLTINANNSTNPLNNNIHKIQAVSVNVPKVICEKCNKEVPATNAKHCCDCNKMTCFECGYSTIDINTGENIITCEECFDGTENKNDIAWDITSFEVKEGEKNGSKTKTSNRKSNKKSKKE